MTATYRGYVDSGSLLYSERLMNTYGRLVKTGPFVQQLRDRMGSEAPPGNLSRRIGVVFPGNSEMMQLTFEDSNPDRAARTVNVLAEILVEEARKTNVGRDYPISIIDYAKPPSAPSKPRPQFNMVLGLIIGFAGSIGLIVVLEFLDTSLRSTRHIEEITRLPTLARVPSVPKKRHIAFLNGTTSPILESFRQLRTNLFALNGDSPLRSLLVTSSAPGEGKTTVVSNLAYSMAQIGQRVVVVDGDFHQPALHTIFDVPNEVGLSTILSGDIPLEQGIQQASVGGIHVIPSGALPARASELLASPRLSQLMRDLAAQYDMVLVDSPALLAVSDASVMASVVDQVLLVVGHSQTRREALMSVRQQLELIHINPMGIILNRANPGETLSYYKQKKRKAS
jgi:capsular exopolysaccharide synthesis family protein